MKSILVIEDNSDIRENAAEILELAGYRTMTAENGKLGVEMALRERPDLVVCDIMMPELDGYGVLHVLRKNEATASTPFIFLTARIERADFRKGMELGADDYLTKPFDGIELLHAIETRLKKSAVLTREYDAGASGLKQFLSDARNAGLIHQLSDSYATETFRRKQEIYQEGKRPRSFYVVLKGKVKSYQVTEEGKEYITDILGEGDFIGYQALLEDRNYTDNAIALEDAELLVVPREVFLQLLNSDMQVMNRFIHLFSNNVKEKEERLLQLAYGSLRKRVAAALAQLHAKYSQGNEAAVLELSREDIAHYVGTATESLIRTLSDFKSEKLIDIRDGRILVSHPQKLKKLPH